MLRTSVRHVRLSSATSWRAACRTSSIVGVGERLGERSGVDGVVERVDDRDDELAAALDGDLHEAQQRLVAPLAHELGVDAEPPGVARRRREVGDVG